MDYESAFVRLEELKAKGECFMAHCFGSGSFGLVVVFEDGSQRLKGYGFDTYEDVKLFRSFVASLAEPDPRQKLAIMAAIGYPGAHIKDSKMIRMDIVRLTAVVDDLKVPNG